jgi:hypothetical protein
MSGLVQLVAYGAQDVYLTGNPQITFFKVVYRRHTNFAMEGITVPLNGVANLGGKTTVGIQRNGDLMLQIYLRIVIKEIQIENFEGRFAWVRRLGHAIIKELTFTLGGTQIDKQYGTWLDVWYELTHDINQERGYASMIGDVPELTELTSSDANGLLKPSYEMYIPMQFWFCRNNGLALPLIALQYHDARIDIEFERKERLIVTNVGDGTETSTFSKNIASQTIGIQEAEVLINYVFLDSEERRRFAQVGHEYLIEQLQYTGAQSIGANISEQTNRMSRQFDLNFNHPTKELIWLLTSGNYTQNKKFLAYSSGITPYGWADAINDAANNIASGMFVVTGVDDEPVPPYWYELTTQTGEAPTGLESDGGQHKLQYSINVIPSASNTNTNSPQLSVAYKVYLIRDVLYNTNCRYNLGDKIESVEIEIRYTDDPNTSEGEISINHITCLKNSLTIRDLSIPLQYFSNDKRQNNASAEDIYVQQPFNYGLLIDGSINPVHSGKIQLNGQDRFRERSGNYFNYVQPYQHHKRTPADGINVYSFAIKPEDHQPSGTANLSRIDTTTLNLTFSDPTFRQGMIPLNAFSSASEIHIYDFNYNVLRIIAGMGGLAYSN